MGWGGKGWKKEAGYPINTFSTGWKVGIFVFHFTGDEG